MRLWLLRHGEAEPRARTDAERNLTDAGRLEVQRNAECLIGVPLEAILASPFQRAQQTAELVRETLGFAGAVETVPWLTPESDLNASMLYLDRHVEKHILLVSHQPFIGALGGWLINGHRESPLPMATASLAELKGDELAAGLMHLASLRHAN